MAKSPSAPAETTPAVLLGELQDVLARLAAAETREEEQLFARLERIGERGPEGVEGLDKEIRRELEELYRKLASARKFRPAPPPEFQWGILEEVVQLLLKLVWKAFYLQKMKPPPLPQLTSE